MAYKPISDYGLIGDTHSAALVGLDGSIDWACFPRFDSPSVFAAILDDAKGGRFQISPAGAYQSEQQYLPRTNILKTVFTVSEGQVEVVDFMPLTEGSRPGHEFCPHEVHRVVRCVAGRVEMTCRFQPRLNYGRGRTRVKVGHHSALAKGNDQCLALSADVPLEPSDEGAVGRFTLAEGQEATFVLAYGRERPYPVANFATSARLARTRRYWEHTAKQVIRQGYSGPWQEQVVRSVLALHLLIYRPTGAIVAAPTTSLPEAIGGERNWDYRYCWLRDAAWTLGVLYRLGDRKEGHQFFRWLLYQSKVTRGHTQILYGVDPTSDLRERTLRHLDGHRDSRPVRIGNGAARHFQLDVFGEVILSIATYKKYGGRLDKDAWSIVEHFAETICHDWRRKDRSIWEVRGPQQHFVYSKVLCWVGLDRALGLARSLGRGDPQSLRRWERTADRIKAEILTKGWSEEKQAFTQSYENEEMDASTLIIPFVGLLPGDDPRILSTVKRIRAELGQGALVRRYNTATTDDGLQGGEGAFTLLSFWLIGALLYTGHIEEAHRLFEELLGYANHLGLFSEMIDPGTGGALGNFPQAFSHIGLLHTARNLTAALNPPSEESPLSWTFIP